ncbi:flavin reductase family protein [Streptomyces sp. NPDC046215]|uniref:Flavin reductase family protein n=2 Tax=Streptomyces stramineus TaxID=173861 RepID=A0ABP3JAU4_9ACTN
MPADNAPPVLEDQAAFFRSVLGNFPSGVTAVTAMSPEGPVGFTCQAFSSLSLDPPQVVLCVSRTSTTWPLISRIRHFCINVLAEYQQNLSDSFARTGGEKFAGVRWDYSPGGSPLLAGASAWIDCELHAEYPGGDHVIAVADVHRLDAARDVRPLLYHRGRYTGLTP